MVFLFLKLLWAAIVETLVKVCGAARVNWFEKQEAWSLWEESCALNWNEPEMETNKLTLIRLEWMIMSLPPQKHH